MAEWTEPFLKNVGCPTPARNEGAKQASASGSFQESKGNFGTTAIRTQSRQPGLGGRNGGLQQKADAHINDAVCPKVVGRRNE